MLSAILVSGSLRHMRKWENTPNPLTPRTKTKSWWSLALSYWIIWGNYAEKKRTQVPVLQSIETRNARSHLPTFTVVVGGHLNAAFLIFYLGLWKLESHMGKWERNGNWMFDTARFLVLHPIALARPARSAKIGLQSIKLLSSHKGRFQ